MILSLLALYQTYVAPQYHSAPVTRISQIQRHLPWTGRFSARKFSADHHDKLRLEFIKTQIRRTILSLPKWHTQELKNLEIHNDTNISRGLSNSNKMILHTNSIDSSDELKSVFIHEMGHIVDLGAITGSKGRRTSFKDNRRPILSDDLSVQFYQISWSKSDKKNTSASHRDFVSGYAQYDCFEDFAETYLLYRLHGEKFRALMEKSVALQKKYSFMKKHIFEGREFNLTQTSKNFQPDFDTTLLSLNR